MNAAEGGRPLQAPVQASTPSSSAPAIVRRPWRRPWALVAVAAVVIALDQLTKSLALSHLRVGVPRHVFGPVNLLLTFNQGAAFSLGAGVAPLVEAVAVALVVGVVLASGRLARRGTNLTVTVGLGLLSGGAVSNLADRFVRHHHGAVVDFVQLVSWWPIFNLADACITVGAVLVAFNLAFPSSERRPSAGPGT
jgi:signal peptidase II